MRTILVVLSVFYLNMGSALAAAQLDLKTFLAHPQKYDGKEVIVRGFLSLEDYGKALFLTQEDYVKGRFENSVPVMFSDNVLNTREEFHRTFVKIRAVYHHDCARPGVFCSARPGQGVLGPVLELWGERPPENPKPLYRKAAIGTVWDELEVSEAGEPDNEEILRLAVAFADIVKTGNRTALPEFVEQSVRKIMAADLNTPDSRSNWLLFSGPYSYRAAFLSAKEVAIILLRLKDDPVRPPVAAACYCVSENCAAMLPAPIPADAVTAGSFADPYKCVPFHKSKGGWVLDAGFLFSFGEETPYGDDLGAVVTEDPAAAVRAFTQPPTYSTFLTRLRERPRPRVVNAVQTGRLAGPVDFTTPSWTLYSVKLEDGHAVLEKLKDLGSEDDGGDIASGKTTVPGSGDRH